MKHTFHSSLLIISLSIFHTSLFSQDALPMQTLDEFEFVANKIYQPNNVNITNRDFKRLAASFDDPSRILLHYPGFSNANDQANGIIYHGLPSHFSGWQLNGLEIVNPNHLSNAGTFSDASSLSAGGVNMFSGNLINSYQYNSSLSSDMKGATLAGISNIKIDSLDKSYAQLSLLGLEVGLQKKSGYHSFFGSYRYSFTGLLGKLGVNFGNEEIAFSDGVIGYNFKKKNTSLNLFFAKGVSSNVHNINEVEKTTFKDYLFIDYKSDINIYQFQLKQKVNNGIELELSAAYSEKNDNRIANGIIDSVLLKNIIVNTDHTFNESKITLKQNVKFKNGLVLGLKEIRNISEFYSLYEFEEYSNYVQRWAILPFVTKKINFTDNLSIDLNASGISDQKFYLTPSLKLKYTIFEYNIINLNIGKSAQIINAFNDSPYTTSLNSEISYQFLGDKFTFQSGIFYHQINDVPSSENYYNTINQFDYLNIPLLSEKEKAFSKGIYISAEPRFNNGYWLNINSTFFSSKFRDKVTNELLNIESNYKVIMNINGGKKFRFKRSELTISSSLHYRGGAYQYSIIEANIPSQFNYNEAPIIRLGDYKRLDFRINYTKGKVFWSLDIQNVLNTLNDAYQYYDIDGLRTQKQLGMIPVLTYKYSF